jgi:dihydroorotate dehydrogenase
MPTLSITVDGLKLPNPFIIASGPPGTNLNVIAKAFQEGWGAVIAKTVSLDASKVINVAPRYAKLFSNDKQEVVGWENIELISDRPLKIWIEEFKKCKDRFPDRVLIASIMEEYRKDAWFEIVERCQETGVDGFELNFSCPHGLPERKMGSAMGEDPEILEEVCGWVAAAAKKPVWAKMTPNITRIEEPSRAALRGGARSQSHQYHTLRDGCESRHIEAGTERGRLHNAGRLLFQSGEANCAAHGDGSCQHGAIGVSGSNNFGDRRNRNWRGRGPVHSPWC